MSSGDLDIKIYEIAKIIFEARKSEAWGKNHRFITPKRENYLHNPECDFDLCIAGAKAILKKCTIKEQSCQPQN